MQKENSETKIDFVYPQTGLNRAARRHGVSQSSLQHLREPKRFIPKDKQEAPTMVPVVVAEYGDPRKEKRRRG